MPLRVRAYLLDGRVAGPDPAFPLDSILAAEVIRREHPESFYNPPPPGSTERWIEAELPLEKRGDGDNWFWACSINQAEPIGEYVTYWNRRFDDQLEEYIDFRGRRGKISASMGRYKAYRVPLPVKLYDYLEWYLVGETEAVADLAQGVAAIGKKPAQGYGLVKRWEVVPWAEDWSITGPGGRLMRPVPFAEGLSGRVVARPLRPPYWDTRKKVLCVCP